MCNSNQLSFQEVLLLPLERNQSAHLGVQVPSELVFHVPGNVNMMRPDHGEFHPLPHNAVRSPEGDLVDALALGLPILRADILFVLAQGTAQNFVVAFEPPNLPPVADLANVRVLLN